MSFLLLHFYHFSIFSPPLFWTPHFFSLPLFSSHLHFSSPLPFSSPLLFPLSSLLSSTLSIFLFIEYLLLYFYSSHSLNFLYLLSGSFRRHCNVCKQPYPALHSFYHQARTLYRTLLCCAVLCCILVHCTALYCTVLCCTVLHCTVLYCTVMYCTALHFNCAVRYLPFF
jgi:hypothetical protein